ncbi:MAG: 30S ribosomal protein S3 [Patescibacteria group bacterium]|nr:30S ribosomal protein S3 [Patescibacteria group bacterium]
MGQKVNPKSFRLGIATDWNARWFGGTDFAKLLGEDIAVREYLEQKLSRASVASIHLERSKNQLIVTIHAARPGVIIGRGGAGIETLRKELGKRTKGKLTINIEEVHHPDLAARVVAESIASQLEKRIAFRRAIRQAIDRVMKAGAQGVKISVAGRLGGADMARREVAHKGKVPLHTLRADIDYGYVLARTTYGAIGIKVWIYKGEVGEYAESAKPEEQRPRFMPPSPQQELRGGRSARSA